MNLDDTQSRIVNDTDGCQAIIATAGSGKTAVLTHRIVKLLDSGVEPEEITAVTFTNKAADEMKNRLKILYGDISLRVNIGTIHSLCAGILRSYGYMIDVNPSFGICDEECSGKLIKEISHRKRNKIRLAISSFKRSGASLNELDGFLYLCVSDYLDYQNTLEEKRLLDFDDLIIKTHELLKVYPGIEKPSYLLVDEFQDTTPIEWGILELLSNNITVVGDPNQCVYAWRGSDPEIMRKFISRHNQKVYSLNKNYRSARKIVDISNSISGIKAIPVSSEDGIVNLSCHFGYEEEATHIALKIYYLLANFGYNFNDMAVLCRLNRQFDIFEAVFYRLGIPHGADNVTISTIHSAKGCEYPVVFMPNLDDFHYAPEELSICYVGMTRAKSRLYLSTQSALSSGFMSGPGLYD